MFVRKRRNRSGSTSVVVIDKSSGKPKELVCIGISSDTQEIEELVYKGKEWIMRYGGQSVLDFDGVWESFARVDEMLDNIESAAINGTRLILSKVYDLVGFNAISDDVLRNLVIARICQPGSKLASILSEGVLQGGYQPLADIPLYGQAVQHAAGDCPEGQCSPHDENIGRTDWIDVL